MKIKKVPVLESFRYGFLETKHHLKVLLPLSALFFVPELLRLLGWRSNLQLVASEVYKIIVFFALLMVSVRLTGKSADALTVKNTEKEGAEFFKGNLIKWALMGSGFALGAGVLAGFYLMTNSPALAILDQAHWISSAKAYMLWLKDRPLPELALTALLLGYLPYRVFVTFNFFGYIIVETGATAVEALKAARALARGSFWDLTLFYSLCGLTHYLGFRIYVVGAIFTFPITVLATVYVYRSLRTQSEGNFL